MKLEKRNKIKKRGYNNKKYEKRGLSIGQRIGLLIVCLPLFYLIWGIARYHIGNYLLKTHGKKTKAVVTRTHDFSSRYSPKRYRYIFTFKGESYMGNSLIGVEETNRIGDSIDVIYLEYWPSMNRPTYFFQYDE